MNELAKRLRDTVVIVDEEAIEIGDLYRRGRASFVDSVRCLIEAGHRLTAKKDKLPHGEWLPWLAANADALGFETPRTAQHLMVVASKYDAGVAFEQSEAVVISRLIWGHGDTGAFAPSAFNSGASFTGNAEWHTPPLVIEKARLALGGAIDLDPASNREAQECVRAEKYFSKVDDGLTREWFGRVFLNPPYAQPDIELFIDKLIGELAASRVTAAILLTNSFTGTKWFSRAARAATAVCFTTGRIRFIAPDGERNFTRVGADSLLLRRRRTEIRGGLRRRGVVFPLPMTQLSDVGLIMRADAKVPA